MSDTVEMQQTTGHLDRCGSPVCTDSVSSIENIPKNKNFRIEYFYIRMFLCSTIEIVFNISVYFKCMN